jgi:hypothetical protein
MLGHLSSLRPRWFQPQWRNRLSVTALSAGPYTTTLHGRKSERGRAGFPHHSPGWAEFTIMMEFTPESGHCQSICLWFQQSAEAQISLVSRLQVMPPGCRSGLVLQKPNSWTYNSLKFLGIILRVLRLEVSVWIS